MLAEANLAKVHYGGSDKAGLPKQLLNHPCSLIYDYRENTLSPEPDMSDNDPKVGFMQQWSILHSCEVAA